MMTLHRSLAAAVMVVVSILCVPVHATAPESKAPIILTLHDWTGQHITTHLMGRVLEEMGYHVKYQQTDYIAPFAGLEAGELHVALRISGGAALPDQQPGNGHDGWRGRSARQESRRRGVGLDEQKQAQVVEVDAVSLAERCSTKASLDGDCLSLCSPETPWKHDFARPPPPHSSSSSRSTSLSRSSNRSRFHCP